MFKIALNAGHYKGTLGKRCLKKLDKNETIEWVLNDRICDKIEKKLKDYEGHQLLRIDDTTGSTDVSLSKRTTKANSWGADFYLSIHHNAGIYGGKGGGVIAIVHTKASAQSKEWQKELYNTIIKHTGLKGNRATPITSANLHEVRETKMPAVLLECGFMDSSTDVPIILTDKFAEQVADACVEVIVSRANLKKKTPDTAKESKPDIAKESKKENKVLTWQKAAIADGFKFPKYGADGKWGSECESVAKKAICKKQLIYSNKNLTKIIQQIIDIKADGKFGKNTKAEVIKWQKLMGLNPDGIVGYNTWKKLLNV